MGAVCSKEESSGPQNWQVSIVLKTSNSTCAKGCVPKTYGFVHPLRCIRDNAFPEHNKAISNFVAHPVELASKLRTLLLCIVGL